MKLPLSMLNCVGYYFPHRKGWEVQASQREMQIKYHPKKPLSREISMAKFQRILSHPHVKVVQVYLGYWNSLFAGYSQSVPQVGGYYLNGKIYTQNYTTGYCHMWTVPFKNALTDPVDVYGAKSNPIIRSQ